MRKGSLAESPVQSRKEPCSIRGHAAPGAIPSPPKSRALQGPSCTFMCDLGCHFAGSHGLGAGHTVSGFFHAFSFSFHEQNVAGVQRLGPRPNRELLEIPFATVAHHLSFDLPYCSRGGLRIQEL